MTKLFPICIALGVALLAAQPAFAGDAPRVRTASFEQLAKPLPLPYDAKADAGTAVAAARERAKQSGKLLLIDMGADWCLDCRLLAGVMELPEMQRFMTRNYEVVTVDVGRFDRNLAIAHHYGIAKLRGVPAVIVVDPATDKILNSGHEIALADARGMSPQGVADWLAKWTR